MSQTIRIDSDVYEALKTIADPFEDTPNTVIRKLLIDAGLLITPRSKAKKKKSKSPNAPLTPQATYEQWLLFVMWDQFAGKGHKREIVGAVRFDMEEAGILGPADYEKVSSGEIRCENTIAWGRKRLVDIGLIEPSVQRGIWELSEKGIKIAKELDSNDLPTEGGGNPKSAKGTLWGELRSIHEG